MKQAQISPLKENASPLTPERSEFTYDAPSPDREKRMITGLLSPPKSPKRRQKKNRVVEMLNKNAEDDVKPSKPEEAKTSENVTTAENKAQSEETKPAVEETAKIETKVEEKVESKVEEKVEPKIEIEKVEEKMEETKLEETKQEEVKPYVDPKTPERKILPHQAATPDIKKVQKKIDIITSPKNLKGRNKKGKRETESFPQQNEKENIPVTDQTEQNQPKEIITTIVDVPVDVKVEEKPEESKQIMEKQEEPKESKQPYAIDTSKVKNEENVAEKKNFIQPYTARVSQSGHETPKTRQKTNQAPTPDLKKAGKNADINSSPLSKSPKRKGKKKRKGEFDTNEEIQPSQAETEAKEIAPEEKQVEPEKEVTKEVVKEEEVMQAEVPKEEVVGTKAQLEEIKPTNTTDFKEHQVQEEWPKTPEKIIEPEQNMLSPERGMSLEEIEKLHKSPDKPRQENIQSDIQILMSSPKSPSRKNKKKKKLEPEPVKQTYYYKPTEEKIDEKPTESKQVVEEPKQVVEGPKQVVEEPKQVVEEPKQVVEEPEQAVDRPKQVVEEPKQVVEEPKQVVEETKPVEEPKQVVESTTESNPKTSEQKLKTPEQKLKTPEQKLKTPEKNFVEQPASTSLDKLQSDIAVIHSPSSKSPRRKNKKGREVGNDLLLIFKLKLKNLKLKARKIKKKKLQPLSKQSQ